MFRFVAVMWRAADAHREASARRAISILTDAHWRESFAAPGVRVFHLGERPQSLQALTLPNDAGIVMGTTFVRSANVLDETPAPKWIATAEHAREVVASRGRWLIDRCWGNYVAFVRAAESRRLFVLKDPAGSLPCFFSENDDVTFICSSPADLAELGLKNIEINREYLLTRVAAAYDPRQQSLLGVEQVLRGECVEFDTDTARMIRREFYWRPQTFVDSDDAFENPDFAARAMRAVVRMSTHTWAAQDERIVLRLSGGLDSSIIAGCLKDAPNKPEIHAYTYFNPRGGSDERPWARLVAAHLNCEHTEIPIAPEDVNLRRSIEIPPQPDVWQVMSYWLRSDLDQSMVERVRSHFVLNGDGGDAVFGAEASRYAASEYVRRHGVNRQLLQIASSIALRTHQSTWSVFFAAVRGRFTGVTYDSIRPLLASVRRLVNPAVLEATDLHEHGPHPWFRGDRHISWATVRRLGMYVASPEFYAVVPCSDVPDVIAPLYAQPVVETLLRIPLYRLFEDCHDRGLARRAFVREVPEPIRARLWKDRAPGFHDVLLHQQRGFIREIFLDGVLVREGLLDRAAIEQALSDRVSKIEVLPVEILRHLDAEIWARAWQSFATASEGSGVVRQLIQ
jgi:asparagine synthase (glutamine-hydrolysing)